jgi:hypothetical protein
MVKKEKKEGVKMPRKKKEEKEEKVEKVEQVEEVEMDLDLENMEKDDADVPEKSENSEQEPESMSDVMPKYATPEWQEFIMGHFTKDELYEGKHPTCAGLRRVGRLFFPVIESGPDQIFVPINTEHPPRATVVYKIKVDWKIDRSIYGMEYDDYRSFSAVSDADHINTPPTYAVHPAAMAETRAEGRCWRQILCLNITSAEEMNSPEDAAEAVERYKEGAVVSTEASDDKVQQMRRLMIKSQADRKGIDIGKLIKKVLKEESTLDALDLEQLNKINKFLQGYQNKDIPDTLK